MKHDALNNLLQQADKFIGNGNNKEAEHLANSVLAELDRAINVLEAQEGNDDDSIRCRALIILSASQCRRGDIQTALTHARTSMDIAERNNTPKLKANALGNLGTIYNYLSDFSNALTCYQRALTIFEEIGFSIGIASNLVNIGIVYQHLSDYDNALIYFQRAIVIFEEIGIKDGIATNLTGIGIVYQYLSDFSNALTYFQRALAIYEEIRHSDAIANNLGNIGTVYANLSDNDHALTYFHRALAIYQEIGSKEGIAVNLGNIGGVYRNLSDNDNALTYFQRALAIFYEIGNKNGIASILGNIGDLYAQTTFDGFDPRKAEEYLLKALDIDQELGNQQHIYEDHKALATLYEGEKRWEEGFEQYKKYHELYLEVQSDDATEQARLMEHRRKIEESERDRQVKLARFQEQEKILHNILPSQIADRMVSGEKTIADSHDHVSVFFSDIVGFTNLSQQVSAQELVGMLNGIFTQFDQLARKHGLEKIKTIGDAYMAVCGAPIHFDNHAERTALFALDVAELMANYTTPFGATIYIRIGLHSGSVVAGIIGENKFTYDMWGDAVNIASRMESHGEAGKIHVSEEFKHSVETLHATSLQLHATSLQFIPRGEMEIKGKGLMKTYFLTPLL